MKVDWSIDVLDAEVKREREEVSKGPIYVRVDQTVARDTEEDPFFYGYRKIKPTKIQYVVGPIDDVDDTAQEFVDKLNANYQEQDGDAGGDDDDDESSEEQSTDNESQVLNINPIRSANQDVGSPKFSVATENDLKTLVVILPEYAPPASEEENGFVVVFGIDANNSNAVTSMRVFVDEGVDQDGMLQLVHEKVSKRLLASGIDADFAEDADVPVAGEDVYVVKDEDERNFRDGFSGGGSQLFWWAFRTTRGILMGARNNFPGDMFLTRFRIDLTSASEQY